MNRAIWLLLFCVSPALAQSPTTGLPDPASVAINSDPAARSVALFNEAAKVITNPRCMNCHPAGDSPTQGNDMHVHAPAANRNVGTCQTCHTNQNVTLYERASYKSIPGNARWGLAPIEMAWQGKSVGDICRLLKDPAHNGGRSLALLQEHAASDPLVAWGWAPGLGRNPAPGSQELFGRLIKAWIDTGAGCPQ